MIFLDWQAVSKTTILVKHNNEHNTSQIHIYIVSQTITLDYFVKSLNGKTTLRILYQCNAQFCIDLFILLLLT